MVIFRSSAAPVQALLHSMLHSYIGSEFSAVEQSMAACSLLIVSRCRYFVCDSRVSRRDGNMKFYVLPSLGGRAINGVFRNLKMGGLGYILGVHYYIFKSVQILAPFFHSQRGAGARPSKYANGCDSSCLLVVFVLVCLLVRSFVR